MMAIGGESTGWRLQYQTNLGPRFIDVDFSGMVAEHVRDGVVRVSGKIIKKNYIERGPTLILKANRFEPVLPPADRKPGGAISQREALAVQNRHTDKLMKLDGVVGVGLGTNAGGQFVIKVMVKDEAAAKNPLIPKQLEGVPVEVTVTGEFRAY
jgi:hypothetical protein